MFTFVVKLALFATVVSAVPLHNKCNPCEAFCPEYLQHPSTDSPSCPYSPSDPAYCDGVPKSGDPNVYLCGDYRLGPVTLPSSVPVNNLVNTYDRLGGLCPAQFLGNWTVSGSFKYPEETGGYVADVHCKPIKGVVRLQVGTLLDRFGGETGNFLSPKGAPYVERALPPVNLNNNRTNVTDYPNGYHVYEVVKEFEVLAGPIAAWFGQPGGGTQYELTQLARGQKNSVGLLLGNTTGGPFLVRRN